MRGLAITLCLAGSIGVAHAEPGLTLGAGEIEIAGETLNIGLFSDNTGKPVSLAPSIWYGVTAELTLGITHDGGTTTWTPRPALRTLTFVDPVLGAIAAPAGAGICVTGDDGLCPRVYDNISLDALYAVTSGAGFRIAAHPAFDAVAFDPVTLSLRLGVLGTYTAGKLTVAFDPRIRIGLSERDAGNKESIDVPVWLWYQVHAKVGIALNSGFAGPFDGFGDGYTIPFGLDATYHVSPELDAGIDFSFVNALGKAGGIDDKMVALRAAYRL